MVTLSHWMCRLVSLIALQNKAFDGLAASADDLGRLEEERRGDREASAWAVVRLMSSSNVMGCSTGKSAGLAPLRILST